LRAFTRKTPWPTPHYRRDVIARRYLDPVIEPAAAGTTPFVDEQARDERHDQ
jgi:hypothetical protein